jgi:hypothetical protein
MIGLLAEHRWPDSFDATVTFAFLATIAAVVVLGYVFMVLDYRTYLRSLHRALVRVVNYLPNIPDWAKVETPGCIAALGLRMPCTEQDLLRAYRIKVVKFHPDRGGDKRRFLSLQQNFEEAMAFLAASNRSTSTVRS